MKKTILLFLPFLLFLAGTFVSCEEVKEVGKYDNWKERNQAFIDSIKHETGDMYVASIDALDKVPEGDLFAIETTAGTSNGRQYVYCKKLVSNTTGELPLFTSNVTTYYYGTYITGDEFDGCFKGYGALDRIITEPLKEPTPFDATASFAVSGVVAGWTAALQFMRVGERWILYIPWESGYGASDYTPTGSTKTIPGSSVLTFDLILESIN